MPSPNLSEIVTTTLRNRSGKLADTVSRNNALLAKLKEKGMIKPLSGGRSIVREIEYQMNATYQRYSGYETLNVAPSDVITAAEFPWRQAAVAVSISGLEEMMNNGKEAIIDLLESRISNAERTMANGISYDIYSDGTQAAQIGGLQALVAAVPTVGVVGGIDRSVWEFFRNLAYNGPSTFGSASTAGNIVDRMNQISARLQRGRDGIDLIVCDNDKYTQYMAAMQSIQRISQPDKGGAGFASLKYWGGGRECDVVLDGGFQGYTSDYIPQGGAPSYAGAADASGNTPKGTMYFLNTNYLQYNPHSKRNMVPIGGERMSVNQDAMVKLIGWMGNMTMTWGRAHAVFQG